MKAGRDCDATQPRCADWLPRSNTENHFMFSYQCCREDTGLQGRWRGLPEIIMQIIICTILDAWGWCTGMTQRDGTGREVGRGFRMAAAWPPETGRPGGQRLPLLPLGVPTAPRSIALLGLELPLVLPYPGIGQPRTAAWGYNSDQWCVRGCRAWGRHSQPFRVAPCCKTSLASAWGRGWRGGRAVKKQGS